VIQVKNEEHEIIGTLKKDGFEKLIECSSSTRLHADIFNRPCVGFAENVVKD